MTTARAWLAAASAWALAACGEASPRADAEVAAELRALRLALAAREQATSGVDALRGQLAALVAAQRGAEARQAELQRELAERAGVGVSMGSTATVSALQRFGSKSIAVLTPHQPRGDEQVRRYFEEAGFSIPRLIGLKCPSPVQIAHTTRQQVVDALHALNGDDVDAIVQVGTNLAAIGICAEAERTFRKPVLAINAITYWDALRRCGIEDRIQGYGRTLEEF